MAKHVIETGTPSSGDVLTWDGSKYAPAASSGGGGGGGTITLSGDVTGSGTSTITTTIANAAVTLAKMANMATASVFYRKTSGSGAPEVQTLATLKTDLGLTGTNSGDVTLSGTPDYITISGQGITRAAINLASHVTGDLPLSNLAQSSSASRLLGRGSASGGGDFQEISIGSGLSMSGTTLSASGGGGGASLDDIIAAGALL